jgi:hypothetical protein
MSPADAPKPTTWDEKCAALESLFGNLQIQRFEKASGIPYGLLIPGMGRDLMLMTPVARPKTLPTKKALKDLAQSAARTVKVLDGFPECAIDALNFDHTELRLLKAKLRIL